MTLEVSSINFILTSMTTKCELNKDTNIQDNKTTRSQPYTKKYRQLRNENENEGMREVVFPGEQHTN